ncbi:acyl-CoA dehydrogenase family protein [Parvularcula marina]|uniref:Pimeloyl-CoA dehydrogenase large subunit n=1 Tax=Parvularcula marina TaxID=2292771 RepID=A0A371RLM7_9PROT|nr:acyl-CoA dehydrogenase family protein [Parvularcula marina]RFB06276.1 pimeloyl-CoA dehydrogenase large subunit [Parvularcula marina]
MDLFFTREDRAFRDEVRAFLQSELSPELRRRVEEGRALSKDEVVGWQRILNTRGWATPSWPKEWGGPGWTAVEKHIFLDELHRAGAPEPLSFNVSMLGPVLIAFGSESQKSYFLPRAANLDDWWAQGFSEPGAGSDLAALSTTAVREGDHYIVNGQKIWQGMAHRADWMFTLVRTDPQAPKKQMGISFLLIDLRSPGIEIRPIITIDGRHEVNEVFLDNVRVPIENRIGEENKGWTYAKYLMSNERTGIARTGITKRILQRIRTEATSLPASSRVIVLTETARLEAELMALEFTQLRVLASMTEGVPDPRSSMLKIKGTELRQDASELLLRTVGEDAREFTYEGEDEAPHDIASNFFTLRAASIYGGANEVQKNILAKTILGQ